MKTNMKTETIEEFLKRGGKVEKLKPGFPINIGSMDKSGKPRFNKQEVESGNDKGTAPMPDLTNIRRQVAYGNATVTYGDKVPVSGPKGTGKPDMSGQ